MRDNQLQRKLNHKGNGAKECQSMHGIDWRATTSWEMWEAMIRIEAIEGCSPQKTVIFRATTAEGYDMVNTNQIYRDKRMNSTGT